MYFLSRSDFEFMVWMLIFMSLVFQFSFVDILILPKQLLLVSNNSAQFDPLAEEDLGQLQANRGCRSPYLISSSLMQSVERILAVFDDAVQFGLINLRLQEISSLNLNFNNQRQVV